MPARNLFGEQDAATALFHGHDGHSLVLGEMSSGDGQLPDRFRRHDTGEAHGDAGEDAGRGGASDGHHAVKQGTFMGVYVPVLSSMFGVIIFVRFSVTVGYAGWLMCVGFAILSATMQFVTTISLCAVLSNSRDMSGGIVGVLCRNLGAYHAGPILLLYYIGITVLASVELLGSVQAIDYAIMGATHNQQSSISGSTYWDQVIIGFPLLLLLALVRAFRIGLVHLFTAFVILSTLFTILLAVVGMLLSAGTWRGFYSASNVYVTGLNATTFLSNTFSNFSAPSEEAIHALHALEELVVQTEVLSASSALSLIFPMFIGIFQGANKAGQLKRPISSVFYGNSASILTAFWTYVVIFLLVGSVATRDALKLDVLLLSNLLWPTQYVGYVGTVLVGVGAAAELLEIGPLVLQKLAATGIYEVLQRVGLHKLHSNGEPVIAVVVSLVINIALLFVTSEYFEVLASVVTVFFLNAYGSMHLSLMLNELQKTAGWRPLFRYYHWTNAVFGFLCCQVVMFYISWVLALFTNITTMVLALLGQYFGEAKYQSLTSTRKKAEVLQLLRRTEQMRNRQMLRNRMGGVSAAELDDAQCIALSSTGEFEANYLCIVDPASENLATNVKLLLLTEQLNTRGFYPSMAVVASIVEPRSHNHKHQDPLGARGVLDSEQELLVQQQDQQDQQQPMSITHSDNIRVVNETKLELFTLCLRANLKALTHVTVIPPGASRSAATIMLAQTIGIGTLVPNVALVPIETHNLVDIVRGLDYLHLSLGVLKDTKQVEFKVYETKTAKTGAFRRKTIVRMETAHDVRDPSAGGGSDDGSGSSKHPGNSLHARRVSELRVNTSVVAGSQSTGDMLLALEQQQPQQPQQQQQQQQQQQRRREQGHGQEQPQQPSSPDAHVQQQQEQLQSAAAPDATVVIVPAGESEEKDQTLLTANEADGLSDETALERALRNEVRELAADLEQVVVQQLEQVTADHDSKMPPRLSSRKLLKLDERAYFDKYFAKSNAAVRSHRGTIDVWWIVRHGGLPVVLPHMLQSNRVWRKCALRVFAVVEGRKLDDMATVHADREVKAELKRLRIPALVDIVQVDSQTNSILRSTVIGENGDFIDMKKADDGPARSGRMTPLGSAVFQGLFTPSKPRSKSQDNTFDFDTKPLQPFDGVDAAQPPEQQQQQQQPQSQAQAAQQEQPNPKPASAAKLQPAESRSSRKLRARGARHGSIHTLFQPGASETLEDQVEEGQHRANAIKLYNKLFLRYSKNAALVVANLPTPTTQDTDESFKQTLARLTEGIDRVLFLQTAMSDDLIDV